MLLTVLERKGLGEVKGGGVNSVESPSSYLGVTATDLALQRAGGRGRITKNKDRHDVWWENHKLEFFYFSLLCVAYNIHAVILLSFLRLPTSSHSHTLASFFYTGS